MKIRLSVILVFLFILGLIAFIEWQAPFPDPDSFYHAKMALIIRDQGFIHTFPWFSETYLADQYIDPHLLYHILLIPFVSLLDPLVGMKVLAVVFGMIAFFALYKVLQKIGAKHPEFLTLGAALSINFLHRMTFPRALSLSVAFFVVLLWFMISQKRWLLFFTAMLFTWLYYGWPIAIVALGAVVIADFVSAKLQEQKFVWVNHLKTSAFFLGGVLAGLVLNPYFPENILFVVSQALKIGFLNAHNMPVGTEWNSISFFYFMALNYVPIILFVFVFALFLPALSKIRFSLKRNELVALFSTLLLAGFFMIMTFKSQRYVEYAIPFIVLFTGALSIYSWPFFLKEIWPGLRLWLFDSRIRFVGLLAILLFVFSFHTQKEVFAIIGNDTYYQASQYEEVAVWLKTNLNPGDRVFTNVWDFSSVLFYLNDSQYYLVGLDPRFFYDTDPARYQAWEDLITGKDINLLTGVCDTFASKAVVVDKRIKTIFEDNIRSSSDFKKIMENDWVAVFVPL